MAAELPTYPLASWTLGGFRAIRDETVFDLGGLNLLVGSNSAGKSCVLHSILLAAQTLGNPLADRPLVLNGTLVRLGLAEDCVHEETGRSMTVGFSLLPEESPRTWRMVELGRLDVVAHFSMTPDRADFSIEEVTIKGSSSEPDTPNQTLGIHARTKAAAKDALRSAGLSAKAANEAAGAETLGVKGDLPGRTAGAYARQFLPDKLLVVGSVYENEVYGIRYALRSRVGAHRRGIIFSRPVSTMIRQYLADRLGDEVAASLPDTDELPIESLYRLSRQQSLLLSELPSSDWFQEHRSDLPFKGELETHDLGDLIGPGVEQTRSWFGSRVRHLGPLRASPQPLYNLPEAASGASVGRNGEYTAAVLSAHGSRLVHAPMPDGTIRRVPLSMAVDRWMDELGLLAAVKSKERGKLGFELEVSIEGVERGLDLTTVGVGVSQALPIVVLGLIADPGSLLLFEQPELHLHPDVQAALGDFFLALARSGRQLVVETHSEYLINRLRRRQMTDSEPDVTELVRLFFFEREASTSKVVSGSIGTDGSMPGWPRGFLDTAAREVEAMVRSAG